MRSIAEIDRDHEGMGRACVRYDHGCNYPVCECDRSKRIVPNVRGIGGPGPGDTCVHNADERHCLLCQRHARQLAPGAEIPAEPQWGPILDKLDSWPNDCRDDDFKHLERLIRAEHARTLDRLDAARTPGVAGAS